MNEDALMRRWPAVEWANKKHGNLALWHILTGHCLIATPKMSTAIRYGTWNKRKRYEDNNRAPATLMCSKSALLKTKIISHSALLICVHLFSCFKRQISGNCTKASRNEPYGISFCHVLLTNCAAFFCALVRPVWLVPIECVQSTPCTCETIAELCVNLWSALHAPEQSEHLPVACVFRFNLPFSNRLCRVRVLFLIHR